MNSHNFEKQNVITKVLQRQKITLNNNNKINKHERHLTKLTDLAKTDSTQYYVCCLGPLMCIFFFTLMKVLCKYLNG